MVHIFSHNYLGREFFFLWDIESGSLHNVDFAAFLCAKKRYNASLTHGQLEEYLKLSSSDRTEINEEFDLLEENGSLNAPQFLTGFTKKTTQIKALCLNICHDCNMRCAYCFADGGTYHSEIAYMTADIGFAAVDFLIANSKTRKNLEIDFFGGEPLLNFDTVKEIVSYAKKRANDNNKQFSFTLTTNCIRLDKATAEYLNKEMSNVVLSIDGRPDVHNSVRRSICDNGTYEEIVKNALYFKNIRGDLNYYVRGTFTSKNLDFSKDVVKLHDLGFDAISVEPVVLNTNHPLSIKQEHLEQIEKEYELLAENYLSMRCAGENFTFFHFNVDHKSGPCIDKRLTGCGAGTEYLAVSPSGYIYPCHQFVGKADYIMGHVNDKTFNDAVRDTFSSATVLTKPHCSSCPAKYHCSGGCFANSLNLTGTLEGQYETGCHLARKRFELALASAFIEETNPTINKMSF
ncbi:MAG: thioether cross-link-forming SCIFF peptide maturase [Christensenellaceae bacterium]|nr:thioether cross-link-forming SCIFF peptide maturase [Christensenellaceae bacterium]